MCQIKSDEGIYRKLQYSNDGFPSHRIYTYIFDIFLLREVVFWGGFVRYVGIRLKTNDLKS